MVISYIVLGDWCWVGPNGAQSTDPPDEGQGEGAVWPTLWEQRTLLNTVDSPSGSRGATFKWTRPPGAAATFKWTRPTGAATFIWTRHPGAADTFLNGPAFWEQRPLF